jgi:hypothetical protein
MCCDGGVYLWFWVCESELQVTGLTKTTLVQASDKSQKVAIHQAWPSEIDGFAQSTRYDDGPPFFC